MLEPLVDSVEAIYQEFETLDIDDRTQWLLTRVSEVRKISKVVLTKDCTLEDIKILEDITSKPSYSEDIII